LRIGRLLEIRFAALPGAARPGQLVLAALVISALAALLLAHHMVWAIVPGLLSLLSLLLRIEHVSRWAAAAAQYASYAVLGGTIVLAYLFMAYPILSQQRMSQLSLLEGLALAGFALGFLFGTEVWRPGAALIPCVLGMFTVAAFNGAARLEPVLALGGVAGLAYLAVGQAGPAGRAPAPHARRIKWRAVFVFPPAALIAGGIIWTLPHAQTRVESATAVLMNVSTTSYSSFATESRLGDLEQLQLSSKVVFRVWSSHPQKLRGRIYTQFDGRSWKAPPASVRQLAPITETSGLDPATVAWLQDIPGTSYTLPTPESDGTITIRTKIVQAGFNPGLLVSPPRQELVRAETSAISADTHQTLTTPLSAGVEIYGILNRRSGDLVQPGTAPPGLLAETLRPPERLDPRLAELARRLATEANTSEDRIRHTVQFVQNQCHYSLEVGKFHSQDPVAEFLFEKRRGYCEYFASAAAVLLRLQGIPCRYVTGFAVQEWNHQGGHFVVREADAHAWIEAYVPGRGWIEADPTPEAEYAAARARFKSGWFDDAKEWAAGVLAEVMVYWRRRDLSGLFHWLGQQVWALAGILWSPATGIVILLVAGSILAIHLWRRSKSPSHPPRKVIEPPAATVSREVQALLTCLDETWSQKGFSRPPSRAPLEHAAGLPAEKITDELRRASLEAVEYFYSVSYGHAQPADEALQNLRQAVERARAS
jgi:transglutaminase-like putative cysteine protease